MDHDEERQEAALNDFYSKVFSMVSLLNGESSQW